MIPGVKIPFEGKTVEADELNFEIESESLGVYRLEDGSRIELRQMTSAIYRIKERTAADGTPLYVLMGTAAVTKTVPIKETKPELA